MASDDHEALSERLNSLLNDVRNGRVDTNEARRRLKGFDAEWNLCGRYSLVEWFWRQLAHDAQKAARAALIQGELPPPKPLTVDDVVGRQPSRPTVTPRFTKAQADMHRLLFGFVAPMWKTTQKPSWKPPEPW